jgi:hypothetical protein
VSGEPPRKRNRDRLALWIEQADHIVRYTLPRDTDEHVVWHVPRHIEALRRVQKRLRGHLRRNTAAAVTILTTSTEYLVIDHVLKSYGGDIEPPEHDQVAQANDELARMCEWCGCVCASITERDAHEASCGL